MSEKVRVYDMEVHCGMYCLGGRASLTETAYPDSGSVVLYTAHAQALKERDERIERLASIVDSLIEQCFEGGVVDGGDWQDTLEHEGILVQEPYSYDKHGEVECGDFEEGDPIYVVAPEWRPIIERGRKKKADAALTALDAQEEGEEET